MIAVFSDFDATISAKDVGDSLFQNFGAWNDILLEYSLGQYDTKELNRRLCKSLNSDLTYEAIADFAITHTIDQYFITFLRFCENNNISINIVSDGYDAYIQPILAYNKIKNVEVYCNSLKKNEYFEPVFFGAVEGCACLTASCKRNVLLNNVAEEDIIVYIGDGTTDFCAAEHSDIIFAKSKLAAYCNKNRIPHYPFKTFFDVYRILENNIATNKIRVRHQAAMKRKFAFEGE